MAAQWCVNGRFRGQVQSGVQRIAAGYVARMQTPHCLVEPKGAAHGLRGHFWEQFALPKLLEGRPLWSPSNVGPLSVRQQVVTVHDAVIFDHPEWFSGTFVATYRYILPRLARRCIKLITVSNFSRTRLAEHLAIDKANIEVIWNGVDDQFTPRSSGEIGAAKAASGIGGERYVITLSTLEPRKNLDLVLKAWAKARPQLPSEYKLVIVGKRGDAAIFRRTKLDQYETSDVLFTGYVRDEQLPGLISGADALLYPSLYEGFGMPIVEAMACGTPAITVARASLPEIAGDAAIYVDPYQPDDLAAQLVRLSASADCRREYGERGRQRALQFSWQNATRHLDEVLSSAA